MYTYFLCFKAVYSKCIPAQGSESFWNLTRPWPVPTSAFFQFMLCHEHFLRSLSGLWQPEGEEHHCYRHRCHCDHPDLCPHLWQWILPLLPHFRVKRLRRGGCPTCRVIRGASIAPQISIRVRTQSYSLKSISPMTPKILPWYVPWFM